MMKKLLTLFLALAASVAPLFAQSGTCGDNLTWTLSDGVLTISGTGEMTNYPSFSKAPWYSSRSSIKTVIIEDGVTTIGSYAFYGCTNLPSITIPNSVTTIGSWAFDGCSSLTSITIPNSVTSIGESAFWYCSSLTSITIPNSVTSIGKYAFYNCSSLTSVTIPNSVTSIGYNAFYNCSSLTSVTIPNSVTSIGAGAFDGCSNLTSLTIGESVTSIRDYAFHDCSSLTSVIWNAKNCNDFSSSNTPFYYLGSSSTYYDFDLRKQITSLTFGDNVESIPAYLCSGMSNLTSITIPNSVTSIGGYAFSGCTYLEDITIGSGINVDNGIGQNAFNGCRYLLSVTCKAIYPPVISSDVFEGCGVLGGIDLYVPEKSVARYKKADVWSEFNIIGKDLSVDDPTNPTNPEDGKYTITWQDEDGNVIKTDQVAQGTTPAFTGTTPTKEGYTFAGWLPNIKPATKDICYTTYFIPTQQQESKVYTVNINGENCSLNINNQYPEGTVITLEAVADECFEFQQWSDGNKDNPRTVTVTANTNLTAEFNKVRYTVTGQPSTGGKVQIRKQ